MAVIGYARVSTKYQSLDNQITRLEQYGCNYIFRETISGAKPKRMELDNCLECLKPGDKLVITKLDRLSRTLKQLLELIKYFEDNNIEFVSLSESLDTSTVTGKLMFHIAAAFAEFERNNSVERIKRGLEASRARGKFGGRKRKFDSFTRERIYDLYENKKMTAGEISKIFNCTKALVYKYIREIRQRDKKAIEFNPQINDN